MELVIACLASYILGSWTVILAQGYARNKPREKPAENGDIPVDRREAKLSEQWDNFFNYTGDEQTGGDEQ